MIQASGFYNFAIDQLGEPWIIVDRNGVKFALGFDEDGIPALRQMGTDWTVHTDLSKATGIRRLNVGLSRCP